MESEWIELRSDLDLREAFDFLPLPILIAQGQGTQMRHVYVNPPFIQQIGYTLAEIPSLGAWYERAYPNITYRAEVMRNWDTNMAESLKTYSNALEYRASICCGDGVNRWFSVKSSFWEKDMHIVAFTDIDQVKQKELELERLNALKDRLFSIISHDVRSPLASLRGLLDLLSSDMLPQALAANLIEQVNGQLYGVSELLDSLLIWANQQLREKSLQPAAFLLDEVVNNVLSLFRPEAKRKQIQLAETVKPIPVWADRESIQLVMRNLVANAIKFTHPTGNIEVITVYTPGAAQISVKDSGVGMEASVLDKLFSYQTLSRPGTSGERGTGLGLIFCRDAVRANGGKIWVESEPGQGSVFSFTIPLSTSFKQVSF